MNLQTIDIMNSIRNVKSGSLPLLGILSRNWVFSGPRLAALIISKECNSQCIMCWYHSPLIGKSDDRKSGFSSTNFMDYDLCSQIVHELHEMGTYRIIIGGHGEPTLHPQFDQILNLINSLRMNPYVISNGLELTEQRARQWSKNRSSFRFSMHAGDADTWLKIHPNCTASQFDNISRGIAFLTSSKSVNVATMYAIQQANCRNIRDMIEHAHSLGVKEVQFYPVRTETYLSEVTLNRDEEHCLLSDLAWCLQYAQKKGIRTNIAEYLASNRFIYSGQLQTHQLYKKIPCYIGWAYTEFDIDGLIRPCENSERMMGHAGNDRINDIWSSCQYQMFRREGLNMKKKGTTVHGCVCNHCPMSKFNINIHNLLHLKSLKYDEA